MSALQLLKRFHTGVAGVNDNANLPSTDEKRPFHLLYWFAGLSLAVIVAVSVVAAIWVSRILTASILARDVEVTAEFVASVVEDANARHVADRPELPPDAHPKSAIEHYMAGDRGVLPGQSHEANAGLDEYFQRLAKMPEVSRVNIYKSDGTVVWSSIPEYIGKNYADNDELRHALAGNAIAHISFSEDTDKTEHKIFPQPGTRYIENYVPIWTEGGKTVAGVLELYKSPQALFKTVDNSQHSIWIAAALVGVFVYLVLFWIVRRGNKIIQHHQERLLESETLLALGEMSAAVAHAIRNPLASVRSASEVALEDGSVEAAHESLKDIVSETDRLEKWVRDLLVYSKPSNGEIEQLHISDVVSDCLKGYRESMEKQHVTLNRESVDRHQPVVQASAAALTQVFNVLIENALQAMRGGGELSIIDGISLDGRTLEVSISDTGRGISTDDLKKVFKPFYTSKSGGLGIGLAIAKRIVERFDGTLDISSIENQGTTATVRLPAVT